MHDLVDMGRHFQVAPDCDYRNLHIVNPKNFQGVVDGATSSDHRALLAFILICWSSTLSCFSRPTVDTIYLVGDGMTRSCARDKISVIRKFDKYIAGV